MRLNKTLICGAICLMLFATTVVAQEGRRGGRGQGGPGGRGPGGFGAGMMGGGMGLAGLLNIEKVQEELELVDDQLTDIRTAIAESRGGRGRGPGAGAPGAGRGQRGGRGAGGEAPDREQFLAAQRQREQEFRAKISDILLPHQMDRLDQIHLQARGVAALADPDVLAKLEVSDEQREQMTSAREELETSLRERMREAFQGGAGGAEGREQLMAQMTAMRREIETKVMAVLTDEQKKTLEEMKGEPFELPPPQIGGFGGRGGRGGDGAPRGGGRGGRGGRGGN